MRGAGVHTRPFFHARIKTADLPGLDPVHALRLVIISVAHARAQMIEHSYVHTAFKCDANQSIIGPNHFSKRCIDTVHAYRDAVTDIGKACTGFQLASTFGDIEEISVDRARLNAPLDHKLQGSPI
jgi:hypothetical protein